MQKRGLVFGIVTMFSVMMINFVSASFHYGYGGSFSLSDMLNSIDSSTMILGALFIIIFAFVNYALSKFFRDSRVVGTVIALAIALLTVYFININSWDYTYFFYNIGISEDLLATIAPLVLIGGIAFFWYKYGLCVMLILLGGLSIVLSLIGVVYEYETLFAIGVIILGIGLWVCLRRGREPREPREYGERISRKDRKKINYGKEAKRLRDKQKYDYYKSAEKQRRKHEERELRRRKARDEKVKKRYIRRYGRRAWKKRGGY
jgi:signal transduction histidine kinase